MIKSDPQGYMHTTANRYVKKEAGLTLFATYRQQTQSLQSNAITTLITGRDATSRKKQEVKKKEGNLSNREA